MAKIRRIVEVDTSNPVPAEPLQVLSKDELKAQAKKVIGEVVELLNHINGFDDTKNEVSRHFAGIITFLRGPDTWNSSGLKNRTTANVRSAIGMQNTGYMTTAGVKPEELSLDPIGCYSSDVKTAHFQEHYERAVRGLRYFGYIKGNSTEGL